MGSTLGKTEETYETMSAEEFEAVRSDPTNGYVLSGCLISAEILANWTEIVDDHVIWTNICERLKIPIPRPRQDMPQHFYRTVVFKNPYGRNLIENPCGKAGPNPCQDWILECGGGEGWAFENPPNGSNALNTIEELLVSKAEGCFATSYGECRKYQTIDLLREGCHVDVLDKLQPKIGVSEWYAARFDCACRYFLHVKLLNKKLKVLDEFKFGPVDEQQWVGKEWHKAEHTFEKYGPGLRYITFTHMGHDLQYWAGHFGSKMTAATVRILLD